MAKENLRLMTNFGIYSNSVVKAFPERTHLILFESVNQPLLLICYWHQQWYSPKMLASVRESQISRPSQSFRISCCLKDIQRERRVIIFLNISVAHSASTQFSKYLSNWAFFLCLKPFQCQQPCSEHKIKLIKLQCKHFGSDFGIVFYQTSFISLTTSKLTQKKESELGFQ